MREAKAIHYHHYQKRVKIVAKKLHNLCDIDCGDWPPIKCHLPPNKCGMHPLGSAVLTSINIYSFL